MKQTTESAPGTGATIKVIGQTFSNHHGLTPSATVKGVPLEPTVETFGSNTK